MKQLNDEEFEEFIKKIIDWLEARYGIDRDEARRRLREACRWLCGTP